MENDNIPALHFWIVTIISSVAFIVIMILISRFERRKEKSEREQSAQNTIRELENDIIYLEHKIKEAKIEEDKKPWHISDTQFGPPDDPLSLKRFSFQASEMETLLQLKKKEIDELRGKE